MANCFFMHLYIIHQWNFELLILISKAQYLVNKMKTNY